MMTNAEKEIKANTIEKHDDFVNNIGDKTPEFAGFSLEKKLLKLPKDMLTIIKDGRMSE